MMVTSNEQPEEDRARSPWNIALALLLGLLVIFAAGVVVGAGVALSKNPSGGTSAVLTMAAAATIALGALYALLRLKPWPRSDEPVSPKTRTANNLVIASGAMGGVIGLVLALSTIDMDDPFALFSNAPLSVAVVAPILAVWLLVVPVISVKWHRNVDEHEAESYKFGGLAALYLYAYLAPAWWLAARAGLAPAADSMVIYLVVIHVWLVGWFWRRYR
jgi:hypothetical protein